MPSNKRMYELTYIINAVLNEEQTKQVVNSVTQYVTEHGGEVIEVDEWGSRRLAYPIEKKRNGYYVNMYFNAAPEIIQRLERFIEIEDNIMRYLTIKYDAKMTRYYEQRKEGKAVSLHDFEVAAEEEEEED